MNNLIETLLLCLCLVVNASPIAGNRLSDEPYYRDDTSSHEDSFAASRYNFDSADVYQTLHFQANWTKQKLFWKSRDFDFEGRYLEEQTCYEYDDSSSSCQVPPIQVFVVPFSHNDPGWLKTFEGYFDTKSKFILDNAVAKLSQYENMTFVWSEISFLAKWWSVATPSQRRTLKDLLNEGRFEILTGGWVMPDEASPSVFALVNQLIEGHAWLKRNLKYKPKSAWSIDPFGHGSVMPYLLKNAGLEGMMIQRLHYAWKHWLAEHKNGNFLWSQRWDKTGGNSIHCLNAPYDLYPTKHACGPTPDTCMKFNFRHLPGKENEEQLRVMKPVTRENIIVLADDLIGQYRRTASLTRNNIVVTGLGNDFEFDNELEWDQQYENYNKLFKFINNNPQRYNAKLQFGTLSDYFQAVKKSKIQIPTFRGDFFPYSDVYFPYPPAYWTGYFGTRPFWKKLSREAEDELRKAEILFSYTINFLRQGNYSLGAQTLSQSYSNLVQARRWVALFQHHDGITGTSPRPTMVDYAEKLFEALKFSEHIQSECVRLLIQRQLISTGASTSGVEESFGNLADQVPLELKDDETVKKVTFFNSLGWRKSHLVRILVETTDLMVFGPSGELIVSQINPKIGITDTGEAGIFSGFYEITFVAYLNPLALTTYEIRKFTEDRIRQRHKGGNVQQRAILAAVQCKNCGYKVEPVEQPFIVLENSQIEVYFDSDNGMLQQIVRKVDNVAAMVNLSYGRYRTGYGSGAYLSRPDTANPIDLVENCKASKKFQIYVTSGPVIKEITVICDELMISSYVMQLGYPEALSALHLTNSVKPKPENFGEFFMRFQTDLNTNQRNAFNQLQEPTFYADTGIGVEKRMKVSRLPYEGNIYPVTNFAYIEDVQGRKRISIAVDRSHGFSSIRSGHIEAIYDRRMPLDDARGMDEGVNDPEDMVSNYVILFENVRAHPKPANEVAPLPSLDIQRASKFLNFQPSAFVYDYERRHVPQVIPHISLFTNEFPVDVFLLNLRLSPGTSKAVPSRKALMTIQNLGHDKSTFSESESVRVLNTDLKVNHVTVSTDLVGFSEDNQFLSNENLMKTSNIPSGSPFELSTFAVHF